MSVLEVEELVVRALHRSDQLVELELHGGAVPVLCVLDEEDHQEGDDRRRRVDDELPGRTEVEDRTGDEPADDEREGRHERDRMPAPARGLLRETVELRRPVHAA